MFKKLTSIAALALLVSPMTVRADEMGSVTGGTRGSQSALGGLTYNSSPPSLSNGQQAALQADSAGNLKVVSSGTPSGTQDVNLTKVAGAAVATGHGTASGSIRVELPTDGTGKVGLNAGSAIIGQVGIDQTTDGTTNKVSSTQATASNLNAQVVGNVASGATDSGNPVKIGGKFSSTPAVITDGQRADAQVDSRGNLRASLSASSSGSWTDGITLANAGFVTSNSSYSTNLGLIVGSVLYNGSTFDKPRNNIDTAALITLSAAAPTTTNSSDQTNYNGRGVNVFVNISAISTQTVVVNIQCKDPASAGYYTMLSSASLASTGLTMYTVYPGAPSTANVSIGTPLCRTWRVQAVGSVGGTVSLTVAASVIL